MPLNVVSNYAANVAHRNLLKTDMEASNSLAKLSIGKRVVSARDDAASMAIGSRMNAEVQGLKQAVVNAGQANSMLQIADGAMSTVSDILTRMKVLAIQASSANLGSTERSFLDVEFQALTNEVNRIAQDTDFNGVQLLDGQTAITQSANLGTANGVAGLSAQSRRHQRHLHDRLRRHRQLHRLGRHQHLHRVDRGQPARHQWRLDPLDHHPADQHDRPRLVVDRAEHRVRRHRRGRRRGVHGRPAPASSASNSSSGPAPRPSTA